MVATSTAFTSTKKRLLVIKLHNVVYQPLKRQAALRRLPLREENSLPQAVATAFASAKSPK